MTDSSAPSTRKRPIGGQANEHGDPCAGAGYQTRPKPWTLLPDQCIIRAPGVPPRPTACPGETMSGLDLPPGPDPRGGEYPAPPPPAPGDSDPLREPPGTPYPTGAGAYPPEASPYPPGADPYPAAGASPYPPEANP